MVLCLTCCLVALTMSEPLLLSPIIVALSLCLALTVVSVSVVVLLRSRRFVALTHSHPRAGSWQDSSVFEHSVSPEDHGANTRPFPHCRAALNTLALEKRGLACVRLCLVCSVTVCFASLSGVWSRLLVCVRTTPGARFVFSFVQRLFLHNRSWLALCCQIRKVLCRLFVESMNGAMFSP